MVQLAAHRGYMSDYPENTMLAFREALLLDIDQIETDVHMTKDGELILMHDHSVDRTTDGTGLISEMTFEEIRALDAGSWKDPRFAGEKVPTLRELLELMQDYPDKEVNIEFKDYPCLSGEFAYRSADKILDMIEEFGMKDRIYVNSFAGDILEYVAKKAPGRYRLHGFYPAWVMNGDFDEETIYEKLFCVCLVNQEMLPDGTHRRREDPLYPIEYFDAVEKTGSEIWVHLRQDTKEFMKACVERGNKAFTSDDPALASEILRKLGYR